ncbi:MULTISPECIES: hypothetical protein [Spirosoma]|uniref:Uncharacterized protein n=1 Tax=Spirosoma liriopis TaxID=2937440 RepID=A0ABT0HPQ2_9BACT|nr:MULTISPECIES: hypothetical protein [Spirosoma]MCK8494145.1 hypothetical protein [Spirosoma liriopis]UHG89160.1 hypothetical protein LQ777_12990 [Spirosoma oryzicola]
MAASNFQIESYQVFVTQNFQSFSRTIKLVSPDLSHGIRVRATLFFQEANAFQKWNGIGKATNVGGTNFDGSDFQIVCNPALFDGFYQVLVSEKPVYLAYIYENWPDEPNGTTKLLRQVTLKTDSELPGDFES